MRRDPSFCGLMVLDKYLHMTSRDAVDRAAGWFPPGTRIGHTGTLDPLATGVLVLCLGAATRLGEYVQRMRKTYRAAFILGARSETDDAEGAIEKIVDAVPPTRHDLERALASFVGEIRQVPPVYSAAKQDGRRAYQLARQGRDPALRPRAVTIYSIQVLDFTYPRGDIEVVCGKGTYIRALVRDLGQRLNTGAYVDSLRRTVVGPFRVEDAIELDAKPEVARSRLLALEQAVADLPRVTLDESALVRLRRGQTVGISDSRALVAPNRGQIEAAVFDRAERLAAVVLFDAEKQTARPLKVLPSAI
jgi:tRNA pseudouridine55 synthase